MWPDLTLSVAQGKPWTQRLGGAQWSSSLRAGTIPAGLPPWRDVPERWETSFQRATLSLKEFIHSKWGMSRLKYCFHCYYYHSCSKSSHMDFRAEQFSPQIFSSSVSPKVGNYRSKWNPLFDPKVFREPSSPTHWAAVPMGSLQCEPHQNESGNRQLEFRLWNIWCGQLSAWSL